MGQEQGQCRYQTVLVKRPEQMTGKHRNKARAGKKMGQEQGLIRKQNELGTRPE